MNALTPYDLFRIFKRRKLMFIIPFGLIFMTGLILVSLLPSYYKSTATILVQEQEIPQTFVMTTVTSYPEQRLQMINQKIMSYSNILDLIDRFKLYEDLKSKNTSEQIVEKMRGDITFEMISSDSINLQTGKPNTAPIVFTLSYEGKNPKKVHQITTELSSQYLAENMATRTHQSQDASNFMKSELNKVKLDLETTEKKISEFKQKHLFELPESLQVNVQRLTILEQSIDTLRDRQMVLREQENKLLTQISSVSPSLEQIMNQKRLDELNVALMALMGKFSREHPDVKKAESEIINIKQQLENNKRSAREAAPDNPTYITLSSELSGIKSEIDSISIQIAEKKKNRSTFIGRIETTSRIESEYNGLLTEQTNLKNKFNDLSRKLIEAKVADGLEKEQKGERLTLIDPARLPEKPFKPNRLIIMAICCILGFGLGSGIVFVVESFDDSLRDSRKLSIDTKLPVLGTIPYIAIPTNKSKSRQIR